MLGFNGVRKGDLNGFWSVFVASFSRRRFACGVDIFAAVVALSSEGLFSRRWIQVVVRSVLLAYNVVGHFSFETTGLGTTRYRAITWLTA
jgi:hypothetical protein